MVKTTLFFHISSSFYFDILCINTILIFVPSITYKTYDYTNRQNVPIFLIDPDSLDTSFLQIDRESRRPICSLYDDRGRTEDHLVSSSKMSTVFSSP